MIDERHDVIILGSGLASLSLSRLLGLEAAPVSILALDKGDGPARKVGESTVEIAAHFFHTRLRLDPILRRTQLPKNGLRFWFDDEEHGLSLREASEDGPLTLSYWQSFQLERDVLERTLLELDRAAGARHLFGCRGIRVLERDADGSHVVSFTHEGVSRIAKARWLVDATGNASFLGRKVGLLRRDERLPHGACWARYRGFVSPHQHLRDARDRRPLYGHRLLSTNHLMNEGYWIWWIPLASGLMSVGLVYDGSVVRDVPRDGAEFDRFLRKHRLCADLMERAEPVDFGCLRTVAWKPERYFATDRTAWVGMAGGFVDPFYSSGSDFIALEADYLVDLIRRDRAGEALGERIEAANTFVACFYEQTLQYFRGLYRTFASHELCVPRYRRDLHVYWNLFAWPYLSRDFLDPAFVRGFEPLAREAHARGEFMNSLFAHAGRELAERGQLRRQNRGEYTFNQLGYRLFPYIQFERQMGNPVDLARARRLLDEIDAGTFLALLDALFDGDRSPLRGLLYHAVHGETLASLRARAADGGLVPSFFAETCAVLVRRAREILTARGATVGPFVVEPASFGEFRARLLAACPDERSRQIANEAWLALPRLEDLSHLPAMRDRIQPLGDWRFDHTPWPVGPVDWRTVYELVPGFGTEQARVPGPA